MNTNFEVAITRQQQVQAALANLCAKEKITVVYGNFPTASFNLETRTLNRPYILLDDTFVQELFTMHEIGHALETPPEGWHSALTHLKLTHFVLNVLEDIRIEKILKEKYPGSKIGFIAGYNSLRQNGFFGPLDGTKDIPFISRLNIFFKCGHIPLITAFSDKEQAIVDRAAKLETWEDVVLLAAEICSKNKEMKKELKPLLDSVLKKMSGSSTGEIVEIDTDGGFDGDDLTDGSSSSSLEEMIEKLSLDSETVDILPISESTKFRIPVLGRESLLSSYDGNNAERNHFEQLVNLGAADLAAEFIRKKTASVAMRTQVYRSGRLDSKLLAEFKTRDDIFRRNEIKPKGKNHGYTILIDLSGSMMRTVKHVVLQAARIFKFCVNENIPCDIFGYSNSIIHIATTSEVKKSMQMLHKLYFNAYATFPMDSTFTCRAIFSLESHIKKMTSAVEISNLIIMTDGEGENICHLSPTRPTFSKKPKPWFVSDPVTGKTYSANRTDIDSCWQSMDSAIQLLKDRIKHDFNVEVIRIFNGSELEMLKKVLGDVSHKPRDSVVNIPVKYQTFKRVIAVRSGSLVELDVDWFKQRTSSSNTTMAETRSSFNKMNVARATSRLLSRVLIEGMAKFGF